MKLRKDFGVRALLATTAVGGAVVAGLYLVFTGDAQLGMEFLKSAALIALGFYFGQASKSEPPPANGGRT